jgi:flagellar biosynthesis/type III secretory pathway M-ring protein FliF/YscJ
MNFLDLSNVASSSLSYISQVFDDVKPILIIVFGLIVGFFIIEKLIELIEEFTEKKETPEEGIHEALEREEREYRKKMEEWIPEEEKEAIREALEREEREYKKVQEMAKRKDVKALEEWLEKWRKGEIKW